MYLRRTNNGIGGIELFHADVNEKTIRIFGEEKKISPSKINVRVILWDINKKTNKVRRDPQTGEPKTITIISNQQYIKSIDVEQSVIIYTFKKKEESSPPSP